MSARNLQIEVRYTRECTDPDVPCREENLGYGTFAWEMEPAECALILVDCWNDYFLETYRDRAAAICRDRIGPLAEVCRKAGVRIIHAPSPDWARNYAEFNPYAGEGKAPPDEIERDWPPRDFRLREGRYAAYREPRLITEPLCQAWLREFPPEKLRINRHVAPQQGDVVLMNGEELQRFCAESRVLHLFYAGFATNICVQFRDYGCRTMHDAGYNVILLRDCTTGIEMPETLASLSMTHASICNIEMKVGTSTTSEILRKACEH